MIFVDSDAFIALNHKLDIHHQKALLIFEKIQKSSETLVTSWDVVDEVATKLSQFLTKEISLSFINTVFNSNIRLEYIHPILGKKTIDLFKKQTSKRVSVTDCANMVIAKELCVKHFFSFDRHYSRNGFELLK